MCIFIYVCVFIFSHICIYRRIYICIYVHVYIYVYIYIYIFTYLNAYIYIFILTHVYICKQICLHSFTHTLTDRHIHTLTDRHVHPYTNIYFSICIFFIFVYFGNVDSYLLSEMIQRWVWDEVRGLYIFRSRSVCFFITTKACTYILHQCWKQSKKHHYCSERCSWHPPARVHHLYAHSYMWHTFYLCRPSSCRPRKRYVGAVRAFSRKEP